MIGEFTLADTVEGSTVVAIRAEQGERVVDVSITAFGDDGEASQILAAVIDADGLAAFCRVFLTMRGPS